MMHRYTIYFVILILLTSCNQKKKEIFDILIVNASIIDIESGKISHEKFIGINKDTIQLVADMVSVDLYDGDQLIDAKDQFAMPGLWDNHVHFRGGDALINENKDLLPLFLAYGVTTVRDMGGDISPSVLQWRNEISEGTLEGPDIFTSGPKIDGVDAYWAGSIPIATKEDIPQALDSLENMKVDFVKTYTSTLSTELYYEIIKEAERRGLKVTGHLPLSADPVKAIEFGLDGVEHVSAFLSFASPVGDSLRKSNLGFGMIPKVLETYEEELGKAFIDKIGSEDFYITPTLYVGRMISQLYLVDPTTDSLLPLIGPGIQKTYERRVNNAKNAGPERKQMVLEMDHREGSMVLPMFNAGITLLAGSDCGPYNSYVYPGSGLHNELKLLVETGLSPLEALSTSVINGPKFFGLEDYYGGIEAGKVAHLILLSKNPLEDIENMENVEVVVKGGKVYDQAKLKAVKTASEI